MTEKRTFIFELPILGHFAITDELENKVSANDNLSDGSLSATKGLVYIAFDREATCKYEALKTAVNDINSVGLSTSDTYKFGDPQYILATLNEYVRDGEFSSTTDLISAYISNSEKYKTQQDFAEAIGTNRQTLHRMITHGTVDIKIFFKALERIYDDSKEI